jgi:hypothetical protein
VTSETDDTVRLKGPRSGGPSRLARAAPWAAGAALVAGLSVGGTWWLLRPPEATPPLHEALAPAAPVQQAFAPAPATSPAPAPYAPKLASEAEILADQPDQLAVYRFAPQPAVIVLQFPSLGEQARMLNRVAALLEKQGYPRDRVLAHAELDRKIRDSGMTPETFYYGHDYRATDIAHFFSVATDLNGEEKQLEGMADKLGWHEHGAVGALISLVRQSSAPDLDPAARATILRHELSHGIYFTDPAYAEYCRRFWNEVLTDPERGLFAAYLEREGYDPALTDLLVNETQAYLIHTRDPRFFRPTDVGLTDVRAAELRRIFVAGMPPGWLRDATSDAPGPVTPVRAP